MEKEISQKQLTFELHYIMHIKIIMNANTK